MPGDRVGHDFVGVPLDPVRRVRGPRGPPVRQDFPRCIRSCRLLMKGGCTSPTLSGFWLWGVHGSPQPENRARKRKFMPPFSGHSKHRPQRGEGPAGTIRFVGLMHGAPRPLLPPLGPLFSARLLQDSSSRRRGEAVRRESVPHLPVRVPEIVHGTAGPFLEDVSSPALAETERAERLRAGNRYPFHPPWTRTPVSSLCWTAARAAKSRTRSAKPEPRSAARARRAETVPWDRGAPKRSAPTAATRRRGIRCAAPRTAPSIPPSGRTEPGRHTFRKTACVLLAAEAAHPLVHPVLDGLPHSRWKVRDLPDDRHLRPRSVPRGSASTATIGTRVFDPVRRRRTAQGRALGAGLAARTTPRSTAADGSPLLRTRTGKAIAGRRLGAVAAQPTLTFGHPTLHGRQRRYGLVARGDSRGTSGFKIGNPIPEHHRTPAGPRSGPIDVRGTSSVRESRLPSFGSDRITSCTYEEQNLRACTETIERSRF